MADLRPNPKEYDRDTQFGLPVNPRAVQEWATQAAKDPLKQPRWEGEIKPESGVPDPGVPNI